MALLFALNYEEGAENCVLHGNPASETFLSEIIGAQAFAMRHMSKESLYEYGSRARLWRVLRLFEDRKLPLTVFGVELVLQRNPEAVAAFPSLGHEIACRGLRWISYRTIDEATERAGMPAYELPSSAGHDAMTLAKLTDVAMLFTRCGNGGISHYPLETMTADDAELSARVFLAFLREFEPKP